MKKSEEILREKIRKILIENSWQMEKDRYVIGPENILTISNHLLKAMDEYAGEKKYSLEDMKTSFECGRNFQLTGENNFNELIENINSKNDITEEKKEFIVFENSLEQDGLVQLSVPLNNLERAKEFAKSWKDKRLYIYKLIE